MNGWPGAKEDHCGYVCCPTGRAHKTESKEVIKEEDLSRFAQSRSSSRWMAYDYSFMTTIDGLTAERRT